MLRLSRNSRGFDLLKPYGPVPACNGIRLPHCYFFKYCLPMFHAAWVCLKNDAEQSTTRHGEMTSFIPWRELAASSVAIQPWAFLCGLWATTALSWTSWQRTSGAGLSARLQSLQPPTQTLHALLPPSENWVKTLHTAVHPELFIHAQNMAIQTWTSMSYFATLTA